MKVSKLSFESRKRPTKYIKLKTSKNLTKKLTKKYRGNESFIRIDCIIFVLNFCIEFMHLPSI